MGQQKMLQQVLFNAKIREGRRQMPIETIDSDDESGLSEDAFTIVKSKKPKKKKKKKKMKKKMQDMNSNVSVLKNIGALTNAVTFRRTGVYVTTVGEKPKVLSSSKGVFDIHEKTTPQQVYSSVAPDLAREDVK